MKGLTMAVWGYIRSERNQEAKNMMNEYVTSVHHLIIEDSVEAQNCNKKLLEIKSLMQQGDILYIKSLDDLGNNYSEIKREWSDFCRKGVSVHVLNIPILNSESLKSEFTNNLVSEVVYEMLDYVSTSEKDIAKQRQAEGIASAKTKGIRFGRPPITLPDNWDAVISDWKKGNITAVEAIKLTGMKRSTFYKMAENREDN